MMEMQSNHRASDSMKIKRIKNKTIETVYAHGSMMLSLGQAGIPGLHNVNKVHLIKQVDRKGKVRILKSLWPAFWTTLSGMMRDFSKVCGRWKMDL